MKRAAFVAVLALVGCSAAVRRDVQTALDVAQIACVIANAETDDASVQAICRLSDALMPDVRRLLVEQRAASRRFAEGQTSNCHLGNINGSK